MKCIAINALGSFLLAAVVLAVTATTAPAQSNEALLHDHDAGSNPAGQLLAGEETQLWTCSMHPQIQLPHPGKCPICGMDLIPLKKPSPTADSSPARSLREIGFSPTAQKLAEIQTQPVERRFVTARIRLPGKIDYDETRLASINTYVPGRVDRLHIDFTGTVVRKGDPMVDLYSPELLTAQAELIEAARASRELEQSRMVIIKQTTRATVAAAREKLRLWGLSPAQIEAVLKQGRPSDHTTILAPMGGVVVHKDVVEGIYVKTGTHIYTIADLSRVWVKLDAYESDLAWIRVGQEVEFQAEAYPGEVFKGAVAFIDPFLDPKTRTVKVRLDAPNPDGRLKPEMFVSAVVRAVMADDGKVLVKPDGRETPPLVIPASAPLVTGTRAVVYVAVPDRPGTFEGREIVLGSRAGDTYLVRNGLKEGERVVTNGAFKIDSAVQILAKPSMMTPEGGAGGRGAHQHGQGDSAAPAKAASPPAGMQVPEPFKAQLHPLMAAYGQVEEALRSEDLVAVRDAYDAFRRAVRAVNPSPLAGHPHMLWMELVMLLDNDAVEGGSTAKLKDAENTFMALTRHIQRMQQQFALAHAADETRQPTAQPAEPVAEQFKTQLGRLLDAYLVVQAALAEDRFEDGREGMKSMHAALQAIDMSLLTGDSHMTWMKSLSGLEQALGGADKAEDLEALRQSFAHLSEELAAVVKTFGVLPEKPIYQMRCPMAFEGKSATWLQHDKELRNPYYGSAMLRCGDIIETLGGAGNEAGGEHQHEQP